MKFGALLLVLLPLLANGCVTSSHTERNAHKVDASLRHALAVHTAGTTPVSAASSPVRVDAQGRVQVYVHLQQQTPDRLRVLAHAGLEDLTSSATLQVVQGWVLPDKIDAIAALPFVTGISTPVYAKPR